MFHVSKRDLGALVTLTPRVPTNAPKSECQSTPRVCFAPTVEQCVMGIVGYGGSPELTFLIAFSELANSTWCPTVYYCDEELIKPDPVGDFSITAEHWALAPVAVERIGYIDCMAMVRDKRIVIVEEPVYVSFADMELVHHISQADCESLLKLLS